MKQRTWLLLFLWTAILGAFIFLLSNPFGTLFWLILMGLLALTSLGFLVLARFLFRSTRKTVKVMAILPFLLALCFFIVPVIWAIDYRILLPDFPTNLTTEAWQSDFEFLKRQLKKHPALQDSLDQSFFAYDSLGNPMSQDETLISFMRLAGKLSDGHTFIHPLQPSLRARYFPLQGYWFEDGYFIVRASKSYKNLVGKKLVAINGIELIEVKDQIDSLCGYENEWHAKAQFDLYIFSANVLHGLGVISSTETCQLEVVDSRGALSKIDVASAPFLAWFFWALKPRDVADVSPAYLGLRKPNYALQHDSIHNLISLPFHMIQNDKKQSLKELSVELDKMIKERGGRVIIDLRNNQGGNNQLLKPLEDVIRKNESSQFYILMSRKTFSAAINFISGIEKLAHVTLVGEHSGAGPNHYGDGKHLWLPKTKLSVFISTRKWVFDSLNHDRWYKPDLPVKYYHKDFEAGLDPWIDAVLKAL
jgi:hypothetical protein